MQLDYLFTCPGMVLPGILGVSLKELMDKVSVPCQNVIFLLLILKIACILTPLSNLQVLPGSNAGSPGVGGGVSSCSGLYPAKFHLSVLL